uniref:Killer cell lectin-like receptor subfamily H member 5 n=2 Tax=Bos taurus TaxID=9913 RepID=A0A2Z2AY59_BOVIN|nr:killer cell lectin-like receptor subfamily H member 5 [Bos taurus]AOQ25790.1 killer cell lectin-like receptor subfamily H member 5 [Bos taurus]
MKNQKESYSEPSLVKDTRRQQMRDSPSAREKLIVVILGIVCFVLMYTIVRVITFIPRTQISEQNKSSLITKLQKGKECKSKWSCCGQRSYYISDELKNFEESKKSCKEMDSTLLKIEDKEELSFIQSRLSYFYWIGLSRKGTRNQWTWEDNSLPFLKSDWNESNEGNCAYIKATKMSASDCSRFRCFIFEK